jgi:hypothetical protein
MLLCWVRVTIFLVDDICLTPKSGKKEKNRADKIYKECIFGCGERGLLMLPQ